MSTLSKPLEHKIYKKSDKGLHPNNIHNQEYDFSALINTKPELALHVKKNKYENESIDFSSKEAITLLNQALLAHFYDVSYYELPPSALIAPIPGRVDYIHYLADLLNKSDEQIRVLDIGTGASCIYPILGASAYNWDFVASDISQTSLDSAKNIIKNNSNLNNKIECRLQKNSEHIFVGLLEKKDRFHFSMCNPPFHSSEYEASRANKRKVRNLTKQKNSKKQLNFAGNSNELWCEGGEVAFISTMIRESKIHAKKCIYFTTLVSKEESLKPLYKVLKKQNPVEIKTIQMTQGNKITRILVWRFI